MDEQRGRRPPRVTATRVDDRPEIEQSVLEVGGRVRSGPGGGQVRMSWHERTLSTSSNDVVRDRRSRRHINAGDQAGPTLAIGGSARWAVTRPHGAGAQVRTMAIAGEMKKDCAPRTSVGVAAPIHHQAEGGPRLGAVSSRRPHGGNGGSSGTCRCSGGRLVRARRGCIESTTARRGWTAGTGRPCSPRA